MSDRNVNEEMQTVMPPGIGEQLKAKREERKLTLLEISDNIHIKVSYLEALERDDYEHMPVAIYTKNYIKKYGNYLGLDGEQLAESFQSVSKQYSAFPSSSVPASEKILRKNKERAKKAEEGDIMPRHWFVFALVILGVIVALVKITGHARQERKAKEAAIKEQKTVDAKGDAVSRELQIIRSVKQEFNFSEKLPEVD
ncbi:helix-turn-helix domain-containing protein [bacterium]|nr:helix-turn-helix domain-containing protein [bacterium]